MRQTFSKLVVTCLMLLTFISISNGQTTVVPGTNTLSAAITAAADGDVLVLSDGDYTESDTIIIDKNLTIKAADGLSAKPVVKLPSGNFITLESDLVVEGIEFDGQASAVKFVYNNPPDYNNLTITNCILQNFISASDDDDDKSRVIHVNDHEYGFENLIIDNCIFRNLDPNGSNGSALCLEMDEGEPTMAGSKNIEVTNSSFINLSLRALWLEGYPDANTTDVGYVMVENSTFYRCEDVIYIKNLGCEVSNSVASEIADDFMTGYGTSNIFMDYINLYNISDLEINLQDVSTAEATNMIAVDPMYVNPANGDLTLSASSPLLTASKDGGVMGDPRWDPSVAGVSGGTNSTIPEKFKLSQNYPNPFNPVTKIKFDLPENGMVKLNIYDILGHKVSELVNRELTAGQYNYSFEAANLPSGIYVYRLETKNYNQMRKMILVK